MSLQKDVPSDESLQGSWVELHFSGTGSQATSHHGSQEQIPTYSQEGDVEKMLLDAQHESGRNSSRGSSQCNSPLRSQTPLLLWRGSEGNSSQSDEDFQERRREVENLMKKNADWIWDWSSRPENNPPKEFLLKYPKRATSLSIRNTSVMKKGGILSADFLKLFLPSLIISHILAVGLGIYIGKRLTSHNTYWVGWWCIETPCHIPVTSLACLKNGTFWRSRETWPCYTVHFNQVCHLTHNGFKSYCQSLLSQCQYLMATLTNPLFLL